MKFRVTASSIIISLLVCLCALVLVCTLGFAKIGYEKVEALISNSTDFGDIGIKVEVESMDGTLAKAITFNKIEISNSNTSLINIEKIDISLGLFDMVKLAIGWGSPNVDVTISNASVYVNNDSIAFISNLNKGSSASAGPLNLPELNITIHLSNLNAIVDYSKVKTNVTNIGASAYIASKEGKISFTGADLNIPFVQVNEIQAKDLRLSVDENLQITASLDSVSYDNYVSAKQISALVNLKDDMVKVATYLESIDGSYLNCEASFSGTTANIDYYLDSCEVDLEAYISQSNLNYGEYEATVKGVTANFNVGLSTFNSLGFVYFDSLKTSGLEDFTLSSLMAQSGELDLSYNKKNLEARLKAFLKGESTNALVESFSTNLDVSTSIKDLSQISSLNATLNNFYCASLPSNANIVFDFKAKKEATLSVKVGSQLDGLISLSLAEEATNTIETKLYLSELCPQKYTAIYNQFLSQQKVITKNTSFNGSIVFGINLKEKILNFATLENLSIKKINDVSKYVDSGLFSMNLAVMNLEIDSKSYSGAVSFESTLNDSLLEVGTLAITSNSLRLSYSGSIDYNNLIPDGRLSLQNAENGSELAALTFDFIEGTKSYSFRLSSPILSKTSIYGTLDWQNEEAITASAFIESNYLTENTIPFDVKVIKNPLEIQVDSQFFTFAATLEDQRLANINGKLNDLEVKVTDLISVAVTLDATVSYDLISGKFDTKINDFSTRVSDFFSFGFTASLNDRKLSLDNLKIVRGQDTYNFTGALTFDYPSLASLASIAGDGVSALVDLKDDKGIFSIVGTVTNKQYNLQLDVNSLIDIKLNLLGTYENGFFAQGKVNWAQASGFDFNAQYKDGNFGLYDSSGNLGSLSLKDIDFNLNSSDMSMLFSFSFENEVEKRIYENDKQSGTIIFSARLESFATSLLSLVTGLDFDVSFTVGLKDFLLDDGYSIPDTSVDIFFSKEIFTLTGNLINGTIDTANKYLDVHVDKNFLFGFDLKGYYGDELDLYASNIYLPLPLVNQFTDLIIMGVNQADITGDLLIQGNPKDPKLYGMLYCQSLEMWLSYLPEQTLSVKNIAISVQDHSFKIARTPVVGHSTKDGRFIDATVSIALDLQNLKVESLEVTTDVHSPVDLWVPLPLDSSELELRGNTTGLVTYGISNGKPYLSCDAVISDTLIDFDIEDKQDWIYQLNSPINLDVTLTIGSDVEFCYPQKDSAFIDFTLSEGETVYLSYLPETKSIETSGSLSFKTGQVYYFQNDFYISEGSLDLTPRNNGTTNSTGLSFLLNLTAKLKDYDSSGDKVEINLILQNATLDNISPRFTSTPSMTENEILSLLGQTILPSSSFDQTVSVASVASLAAAATDAISRLGLIESNNNYSLTATIRESLGFDIFSLRSNILQNIIIDALPGQLSGKNDISLLSRYLDGTSLFAGKYLASGVFAQMSFRLKSDTSHNNTSKYGHFLSNDLILDMEFSVDWDNPIGTFTIFTNPQELSAFNILDTIGFSVTKRIQF